MALVGWIGMGVYDGVSSESLGLHPQSCHPPPKSAVRQRMKPERFWLVCVRGRLGKGDPCSASLGLFVCLGKVINCPQGIFGKE